MDEIRVSIAELEYAKARMNEYLNRAFDTVHEMDSAERTLQAEWQGDAAVAFHDLYEHKKTMIVGMLRDIIPSYISAIDKSIDNYRMAEKANMRTIGK